MKEDVEKENPVNMAATKDEIAEMLRKHKTQKSFGPQFFLAGDRQRTPTNF